MGAYLGAGCKVSDKSNGRLFKMFVLSNMINYLNFFLAINYASGKVPEI